MPFANSNVWLSVGVLYGCIYAGAIGFYLLAEWMRGLIRLIRLKRSWSLRRRKQSLSSMGALFRGTPFLLSPRSIFSDVYAGECPHCGRFDWFGVAGRECRCSHRDGCGQEFLIVYDTQGNKWPVSWETFEKVFPLEQNPCTAAPCDRETLENIDTI